MQKYYDKPELYTVTDGHIWCGSLWVLRLDNHANDYVRAFLGDIGRDLPRREREYWRTFNVASDSGLSDTIYRRAFLAEWAEAGASDLLFRSRYRTLIQEWFRTTGWSLFLDPEPEDASMLRRLRLPLNDSQPEFETALSLMVKLLVDSLNERSISTIIGEKLPTEKGISKFGRPLVEIGYPHADRDTELLRSLQELRSTGMAHRKGSQYQKTIEKILGDNRGRDAIESLMDRANEMMDDLSYWVANMRESSES